MKDAYHHPRSHYLNKITCVMYSVYIYAQEFSQSELLCSDGPVCIVGGNKSVLFIEGELSFLSPLCVSWAGPAPSPHAIVSSPENSVFIGTQSLYTSASIHG